MTTKGRIVFDASAKTNRDEPGLNDCLYSGPCLLPQIFDILLRFRLAPIALVSDIKQAFLNVEVSEEHRGLLKVDFHSFFHRREQERNVQGQIIKHDWLIH